MAFLADLRAFRAAFLGLGVLEGEGGGGAEGYWEGGLVLLEWAAPPAYWLDAARLRMFGSCTAKNPERLACVCVSISG